MHNARAAQSRQSSARNFTEIDALPEASTCGVHDEETLPSGQVARSASQSTAKRPALVGPLDLRFCQLESGRGGPISRMPCSCRLPTSSSAST